jgi:hypothetical protein
MVAILSTMGNGGHFVDNGEWWSFCRQWGMVAILSTMGNGVYFVDNGEWKPFF